VLIQLPMYNEDAHCDLIIQRCCKIMWPSHRILIQVGAWAGAGWQGAQARRSCSVGAQHKGPRGPLRPGRLVGRAPLSITSSPGPPAAVELAPRRAAVRAARDSQVQPRPLSALLLCTQQWHPRNLLPNCSQPTPQNAQVCDDSTREAVRKKVDAAVISALEQGHNVQLVRRDNRSGFKAGAMVDGMKRVEDQGFEFVAIFDADFEPPEDFFYQTIVHMMRDDNLAFVQTRWTFTNSNSLLTWAQKVGLEFHFAVEQRARSFLGQFFNFNGTAGVWRIKAINDAGGGGGLGGGGPPRRRLWGPRSGGCWCRQCERARRPAAPLLADNCRWLS
jgi:cellulose synthase/poly-beta-1,6-N-acetylglucosamine synthase-like glycosyltransferase